MTPSTGTALILLVAFVLPGFVTVLIQERTFRRAADPTPFDRLLRSVYYSVWSYLVLAVFALLVGIDRPFVEDVYTRYESDPAELIWRGAIAVLLPSVAIATLTRVWSGSRLQRWVLKKLGINDRHEEPTGWDFYFRQRPNCYVRATLKDGRQVLGYYGARSFSSYAKDGRDLYLERLWIPDEEGWFGCEAERQQGVWINTEDAVFVEFYDLFHEFKGESSAAPPEAGDGGQRPGRSPTS